jgi:hypothetical protein
MSRFSYLKLVLNFIAPDNIPPEALKANTDLTAETPTR